MTSRRFAIMAAGLCGTAMVLSCVIAALATFNLSNTKNTLASSIDEQATEAVSAAAPMTAIAEASLPESSHPEAPFAVIAAVSTPDFVHTDAKEAVSSAEILDESLPNPSQALATETRPVQIATVSADDVVHGDFNGVVSAESLPDSLQALAPETPANKEAVSSNDPIKEFTTFVDEDFTWKDPKAAEKAGMSLMEYVIAGMDRDFKLKLYHALRAMDDAGLSPGITSAFRDDYRQSLASGVKAATDRSYHGGSFRGGYGHGLAADIVSVRGETRAERLTSSESLWKWIDAHGNEFGIGRPYLDRDPPHVAPIDGKEYADHRRGANTQHALVEIKKRNLLAVRDDHSIAKLAKSTRSSNF
jgi:hypothetical protein